MTDQKSGEPKWRSGDRTHEGREDLVMRAALNRLFNEHPASVGETYLEHALHAVRFGAAMLRGALACFLHAVVPALCTTTGSRIIDRLHDRMILNRARLRPTARSTSLTRTFSPSTSEGGTNDPAELS
jgi:hypothetical protein